MTNMYSRCSPAFVSGINYIVTCMLRYDDMTHWYIILARYVGGLHWCITVRYVGASHWCVTLVHYIGALRWCLRACVWCHNYDLWNTNNTHLFFIVKVHIQKYTHSRDCSRYQKCLSSTVQRCGCVHLTTNISSTIKNVNQCSTNKLYIVRSMQYRFLTSNQSTTAP